MINFEGEGDAMANKGGDQTRLKTSGVYSILVRQN